MKQFYLALDLKNEPEKIDAYKKYHQRVWPEILRSIGICGITSMKIYSVENRLFMIIEAEDDFSFANKKKLDQNNFKVQKWETLMWKFQQALPNSKAGEKWRLMEEIFSYQKKE